MKRICASIGIWLCLAALSACGRTEGQAEAVAGRFLKAYYSADYDRASELCTPALGRLVAKGASDDAGLPEATVRKMKEALSGTSFNIVSVEAKHESPVVTVWYELSAPGLSGPLRKKLVLQLEGRSAAVDRIE